MPNRREPVVSETVSMRRIVIRFSITFALFALVLFGGAGTLRWPEAWIFLAGQIVYSVCLVTWLRKNDPALLQERMKFLKKTGKGWDKVIVFAFTILSIPMYALPGVDAVRFQWSHVPLSVQAVAYCGIWIALYIVFRTMQVNTFLTPVVEIQKDRGHKVITTGPYAYVRHPMYAGVTILVICLPLFFGSLWSLLCNAIVFVILIVRIVREDRTLHIELDGYREYARQTRYRLVPGIW